MDAEQPSFELRSLINTEQRSHPNAECLGEIIGSDSGKIVTQFAERHKNSASIDH